MTIDFSSSSFLNLDESPVPSHCLSACRTHKLVVHCSKLLWPNGVWRMQFWLVFVVFWWFSFRSFFASYTYSLAIYTFHFLMFQFLILTGVFQWFYEVPAFQLFIEAVKFLQYHVEFLRCWSLLVYELILKFLISFQFQYFCFVIWCNSNILLFFLLSFSVLYLNTSTSYINHKSINWNFYT